MEALPNLHPAVLHFPIVLLPVTVALETIGLGYRKTRHFEWAALVGWVLTALAAFGVFRAGRSAADGLVGIPPAAQPAIGSHADAAWWLVFGVTIAAVVRLSSLALKGKANLAIRAVAMLVGLGVLLPLLTITSDRGGALVYTYGLGVKPPPPTVCPVCPELPTGPEPTPPSARWALAADGSATWTPIAGDLGEGSIVEILGNAAEVDGTDGLVVSADGRAMLLLPETWSDVHVNITLELDNFEGTVGAVHHVSEGATSYGAFVANTSGTGQLTALVEGEASTLDDKALELAPKTVLSVSAAGTHIKGLLDGKVATHGHAPALDPGRMGVLIEGTGPVKIVRVEAIPLKGGKH